MSRAIREARPPTDLPPGNAGQPDPAGGDASVNYGATYAGTFKGGASPGRYNPRRHPE